MPKLARVRSVPWFIVAQAALVANTHWKQLEPGDRARLTQLLKRSKGLPANLTPKEREEVRLIMGRLDLATLGRELVPFAMRGARRGGRARRR